MRVFVTGGAGYIGSVCVEELLRAGHRVFVYDNLSEGHRKAVPKKAEFLEAELADKRALRRALSDFKTDAVLHFAASALVGESMANPAKYFENNVGGGLALVEAAVSAGVRRLVFSSTCATYGLPERVPIPEDHPQRPINPYGQSKLMFEQILEWYGRLKGLVHVSLRYFNAAGASEEHGEDHRIETHLIPNVLKVALDQAPHVEVFGNDYATPDGTCIRDYIHVLDLADAHIRALSLERPEQINLGTGNGTSVQQVIDAARRITRHEIPAIVRPRREGDPDRLVALPSKAQRVLRWTPRFPRIESTIESAWNWHRKHPHGYAERGKSSVRSRR